MADNRISYRLITKESPPRERYDALLMALCVECGDNTFAGHSSFYDPFFFCSVKLSTTCRVSSGFSSSTRKASEAL